MKIRIQKIFVIFLCGTLFCIPSPAKAKEYVFSVNTIESDWEKSWEAMKEQLPEDLREEVQDYYLYDTTTITDSRLTDSNYWWDTIKMTLKDFLFPAISDLSVVLGAAFLIALCQQIPFSGCLQKGMLLCCDLSMAIILFRTCYSAFENAERYIQSLCSVMTALVPVMSAVSYASGEITAAAVQNTAITLFLTVITNLNNVIVRPLLNVVLALTITGAVCPDISLGSFTGNVKKIMMTSFSFILLLYSFVYGIQTSLARAADSLGLRTIRFALSNFIPIVGGPVSDAFSALRSGMGYVRSVAGIGGISILLLMILPVGISLWMTGTVFSIGNTASELLGCSHGAKLLSEMHSILQIVSALVWMITIFFLFSIILFTQTAGQTA